jgi:hypothetical protein
MVIGVTLLGVAIASFAFGVATVIAIKKLRNYQIQKENDNEIY